LNFWSAGCATGEEPYSIAITLNEYLPDFQRWVVQVVGTDINLHALQAAQKGLYRQWAFRHTSTDFQLRYFDRVNNGLQLKPHIREMVSFRQNNLLTAPPQTGFDVIFCCNVLLYFKDSAAQRVETNLYDALTPGGWLVLGQAETLRFGRERWTTHVFPEVVAYQKPHTPGDSTRRHTKPLPSVQPTTAAPPSLDYTDAVQALHDNDYQEADRVLAHMLEQNPANASAHTLLGCLFANQQAIPEALMHLDLALRLNPLQADAHYLKGVLHLEMGKTNVALEALRAAIYCQRGHALAAMILGHLYIEAGEIDRARRTWEEALQMLAGQLPDSPVSDVSDLSADAATTFFNTHLQQLRG
jgi:chemotaxis protein methyltransferase CheR